MAAAPLGNPAAFAVNKTEQHVVKKVFLVLALAMSMFVLRFLFSASRPLTTGDEDDDTVITIDGGFLHDWSSVSNTGMAIASSMEQQWIGFPSQPNYTSSILLTLSQNGTLPCHNVRSTGIRIIYPSPSDNNNNNENNNDSMIHLAAGEVHRWIFTACGSDGRDRCSGGDYYETDLTGPDWKSRPPVTDLGNGSYELLLQVHPDYAGIYDLKVVLLFSNFHGLHQRPQKWARLEEMLNIQIEFVRGASGGPNLAQCVSEDYSKSVWSGRWTRPHGFNSSSCGIDKRGRFPCLDLPEEEQACEEPWCRGKLIDLESSGWIYSAHCSFTVFSEEEAWKCLDKKWLFFWGDSNHIDTIRNMLNFVLGFNDSLTFIPRRFDRVFARPRNPLQSVRITSMFNGHWNESHNFLGLYSLSNAGFRAQIRSYFVGPTIPDVVVMNSGLHDGLFWKSVDAFAHDGMALAEDFWIGEIMLNLPRKPKVIYRTTVAAGGILRSFPHNPNKMEVYNSIMVERMRKIQLPTRIVDGFDLTYPWHFDNNCSDGVHYGKPPARRPWFGQLGHQYFVDLMLVHILLNAICID